MDQEELLDSRHQPAPRRLWLGLAGVAVLAIGSFLAVRVLTHSPHRRVAVPVPLPSFVQPLPSLSTAPEITQLRSWPTASGACGDDTQLPLVSSVIRPRPPTGIHVLVGGQGVSSVDFDANSVATAFDTSGRTYVWQILPGSPSYALTSTCGTAPRQRLLRLDSRLHPVGQISLGNRAVLTDGSHTWLTTWPDNAHAHGSLAPLGGGRAVRLPAGFSAAAITNGVAVGSFYPGSGPGSVGLVDVATGQVRRRLGPGVLVAVGHGLVVWSDCPPGAVGPCRMFGRPVDGTRTRTTIYPLPRSAGLAEGVVSPDGHEVAFTLQRAGQDPRYDQGHPMPPADVAVLHLDTGALDLVPDIELPAKSAPALAFSTNSRWLVIGLDAGTMTRLLAWHPGLRAPYETAPVLGRASMPVAMAISPG